MKNALESYCQYRLSVPFKEWAEKTQTSLEEFKEIIKKASKNSNHSGEWWNKRPLLETEKGANEIWIHVDKDTLLYWDLDCYHNWTKGELDDILTIEERFEEFALLNMNQIEVSYA